MGRKAQPLPPAPGKSLRVAIGVEPHEGEGNLAVELAREPLCPGAGARAQPRRFGLTHLPEPPVLQGREDGQQRPERDRAEQKRAVRAKTGEPGHARRV